MNLPNGEAKVAQERKVSNPPWIITAQELQLELSKVVLVDVREPEEFNEARIDGCKLIPLGEISHRGPNELQSNDPIVLYCAHGVRSLNALMALKSVGFKNLRSLDGGISSWIEAGFSIKSS